VPSLIIIHNNKFSGSETEFEAFSGNAIGERSAWVTDIACKDITVYYDEGVPLIDGKPTITVTLCNSREDTRFENIAIENIVCNGKRLGKEDVIFCLSGQNEYSFK
jgi:hypothetical protein